MKHDSAEGGILAKKWLWIGVGASIFPVIAFASPAPQKLIETPERYGHVKKMMDWGAHRTMEGANKAMVVLGIVPIAVLFFATEAGPISVTSILMPISAYFSELLPFNIVGKTFAGDAPMFMLGILALGACVVDVGIHIYSKKIYTEEMEAFPLNRSAYNYLLSCTSKLTASLAARMTIL